MATQQIFFTHVMKTGGTSLSAAITDQLPPSSVYPDADASPMAAKTFTDRLLGLDDDIRAGYRFINVHHPAWVAFAAAPGACKVTVLREPVARTVSHLRQLAAAPDVPDDLEQIYADCGWRDRLSNYQTQLFAGVDLPANVPSVSSDEGPAGPSAGALDEAGIAALRRGLAQTWGTAIMRPIEVDASHLDLAIGTLERYDCVGITEDLASTLEHVSERTGLALPKAEHLRRGEVLPVPEALLERIADDNRFDTRLHAAARKISRRAPSPGA